MFDVKVSVSTVRRTRVMMGWISKTTQYCQTVRGANIPKRFDHALQCMKTNENFDDVVFTDELTIKIQSSTRRTLYKSGEKKALRGKPKHPFGLHVWAGISRRGATEIHVFNGRMNSQYYQGILGKHLIPFGEKKYPEGFRLMQDNDPKHVSESTKQFMKENKINHWVTPPESPDMNPIENLWAELKHYIRKTKKPKNKQELIEGILEYWKTVNIEKCNKYINHLYKVIPEVIRQQGQASGY